MNRRLWVLLIAVVLAACRWSDSTTRITLAPSATYVAPALDAETATLASLERIDDYPLYTMHYVGDYRRAFPEVSELPGRQGATWACSLFAALGDPESRLYGRNYDWQYSPALLLFTDPPDGYASVSMVDIAYLVDADKVGDLADLPLDERGALLDAPFWPFDGMNERGLVVGMAAVPSGDVPPDPGKETIDSLRVMREVLDRAQDVDEAVTIIQSYNIDWNGAPPLHYLVADRSGRAILVELYDGQTVLIPNDEPWHQATNFLRAAAGDSVEGQCWRYDRISDRLAEVEGRLTTQGAMDLLAQVSEESTQWSVVYDMSAGAVTVAMGRAFDRVHTFSLADAALPQPATAGRTVLTFEQLTAGPAYTSPVDEGAFAIPADAAPPDHTFEGRLELFGEADGGDFEALKGGDDLPSEAQHLPEFDLAFVQSGSFLIPARRGLVTTGHPFWDYLVEPGRVWSEPGDRGYSRASFPFALVPRGQNCTFNGVMTFLFDDSGVSQVWYQVTQETCWSAKLNLWGLLDAAYHPGRLPAADRLCADFEKELADRFPTQPITQLAEDYPGVDLSAFGAGVSPAHMTWYGVVVDGVNYVGGCQTRYGQYAYCNEMRAPSYSTAKSIFASGVLMRLAQKYDPGVPDLLIKDYVPEAAASRGDWSTVTFEHVLDMATGNYRSNGFMVDEEKFSSDPFWSRDDYAGRIAAAFDWPHTADPGTVWVYRTSDTFILTRALHNYLQTLEGLDADIWEFFVDEVLVPIKVGPGAYTSLRTQEDDGQGQVFGGYGLWWTPDDVAKIATFFNNDGGAVDGEQLLHPDLLADALFQNPDDLGLRVSARRRYNNGFWADEFTTGDGFDCDFWVPNMLGYSGNVIALMPNGVTYYYFSDNQEFTFDAAVKAAGSMISPCVEEGKW